MYVWVCMGHSLYPAFQTCLFKGSETGLKLQLRLQLWPGFTRFSPICFLYILCEDLLRIFFLRKVASRLLIRVEREGRSYMKSSNNKKRLTYINACIHAYRQRYIHIWKSFFRLKFQGIKLMIWGDFLCSSIALGIPGHNGMHPA